MPFNNKQLEILRYNNRVRPRLTINEGSIRTGKTIIDNYLFLMHMAEFKNENKKFIITGATLGTLKKNVLDEFENIFGLNTTLNKYNEFKLFGNTVSCFGCKDTDDYKSMKGFTAYGWLANEVTEYHINSIDQANKRCSGEGSRIFWDTNPSSPKHFIKTNYIDRDGEKLSNGQELIKSWHWVLEDNSIKNNGFLSDEYIESIKVTTPSGMWYDRDILGLWVSAEGMIYKDFDYSKHVINSSDIPEIKEYWASVDWGFNHKGVIALYGRDTNGLIYRLREVSECEKTIDYWKEEALRIKSECGNIPFYCDSARPDYIQEFKNVGIYAKEADKAVLEGITFVAAQFRTNQLFIIKEHNRSYLEEIYNYRWRTGKDEPIKENDDSMDSERYALYSHLGKGIKQIKATVGL